MGLLDKLASRRPQAGMLVRPADSADQSVFSTKALRQFLSTLTARETPVLLDLGPVIGTNVNFFGQELGCKIFVEDIFRDLDRFVRQGKAEEFSEFLVARFPQGDASIDGILCWDIIDYLDRPAAKALAAELTRVLRPGGALLGFFGTAQPRDAHYTRHLIVDDVTLQYRTYPAERGRQAALLNRDIIRLFPRLRVSDSFLLKNNLREILFRKPA